MKLGPHAFRCHACKLRHDTRVQASALHTTEVNRSQALQLRQLPVCRSLQLLVNYLPALTAYLCSLSHTIATHRHPLIINFQRQAGHIMR